jgi:peroxiredoxin
MESLNKKSRSWPRYVLVAAALLNIGWGFFVVLSPQSLFDWGQLEPTNYPVIWQALGLIVISLGIGYWIASRNPLQHWAIVLVGLLGKLLGSIFFAFAVGRQDLPLSWLGIIVAMDLIWVPPFVSILYLAARHYSTPPGDPTHQLTFAEAMTQIHSHRGATLAELSENAPTLVVMLRHAGCTFCRETLTNLAKDRSEIERLGMDIAIVHMNSPLRGTQMTSQFGLEDVHRFSDSHCEIYRAFQVPRGTFRQLFGLQVMIRGFFAALVKQHGFGGLEGDGFQMPGTFILHHGHIIAEFRPHHAGHLPRLAKFVAAHLPHTKLLTPSRLMQPA